MLLRTLWWMTGFSISMMSFAAGAAEIEMVQVSSSYPAGYKGKITAQIDERAEGVGTFHFTDSRGSSLNFTSDQLRKGVVLLHTSGKDILKISGPSFTNDQGGQLILTFLKGFFGSDRREVRFDYLRRGAVTDWLLQTNDPQGKEPFTAIRVGVYKKLGVPAGVASITLSAGERVVRKYNPNELPPGRALLGGVDGLPEFLPLDLDLDLDLE